MLGPLEVRAPGSAGAAYRTETATLLAMAALCPDGVPATLVSQCLPAPGAVEVVTRQIQDWLGVDAVGQPRFAEQDGRWRLAPDVRIDWRSFQRLATAHGPPDESRRLASALALIRGELCAGIALPPVAQSALAPHLATVHATVVEAVGRDMELALAADDPARAEWALRQGLTLLPREEKLWRMRLGLRR